MTDSIVFLIYAAVYRLAVLAVGALSIWLGFHLFNNVSGKGKSADSAGSASAEGGGFKLRLTSILPGTYFALFGTVIVSVMLWKGEPPQLNEKKVITVPKNNSERDAVLTQETLMRESDCQGGNLDGITYEVEKLSKPNLTFAEAAEPLSKIACFYSQKNRSGEAVAAARLASYGADEKKSLLKKLLKVMADGNGPEAETAREELAELQERSGKQEKQP